VSGNAGGGSPVSLGGAVYAPNANVTWNGTSSFANNTCAEVVAHSLTMGGNAYVSTNNCVAGTIAYTQIVALVR
jgi:hypothetical protein